MSQQYTIKTDNETIHGWTGYTQDGGKVARPYCGATLRHWAWDPDGPWPMSAVTCKRCKVVILAEEKREGRKNRR